MTADNFKVFLCNFYMFFFSMWFGISSTMIFDSFYCMSSWFSNTVIRIFFCRTFTWYIIFCWCSNFVQSFVLKQLLNHFPVKAVCTLTFAGRILLTYLFIELTICINFSRWYGRTNKWFLMLAFSSSFTWIYFSDCVISLISLKTFVITQCE